MAKVSITQLFIYPVKSLAGIAVERWPASATGFKHDREFMLVDERGRFITQRQEPRMALIHTSLDQSGNTLTLSCEGLQAPPLTLSDKPTVNTPPVFMAKIWSDDVEVCEPCPEISIWLSQRLNRAVRLVALAARRPQSQPERFGADSHTVFADAAPYLVANQASLDALNHELLEQGKESVDIRRFRPNIVVSGEPKAFAEHALTALQKSAIPGLPNGYRLSLVDHCQRCVITTIDPDKGARDDDMTVFKTLARINQMPQPPSAEPRSKAAPAFAVNALLAGGHNTIIQCGDALHSD